MVFSGDFCMERGKTKIAIHIAIVLAPLKPLSDWEYRRMPINEAKERPRSNAEQSTREAKRR